ncbi:hypothetical protein [Abyssogena phaseoliformis symbiont]|uniref:hypothetical protein n=1 Tax=Abyssogena phaseoliformis symbiont TaxID=596095 RepID=UPI001916B004|nr:hypothetical protein [Abyssogena phaseoliformis symbiont]
MLASSIKTKTITAAQALWSIGAKAATTSQWLLNTALNANPIGVIIAGVGALTAGVVYLYKNFEPFTKLIDAVWAKIKGVFSFIVDSAGMVSGVFSTIGNWFGDDGDKEPTATTAATKKTLAGITRVVS